MQSSRKVLIDCDVGTDDAQAIMMLLAQKDIEIVAITTVFGNSSIDNVTRNVLRLLKFCKKRDIPVFRGCASSLLFHEVVKKDHRPFHGYDGLGDTVIRGIDPVDPSDESCFHKEHAAQAICRLVSEQPGVITLMAIGPLANIAVALKLDPKLGDKLQDCVIMGGNIKGHGNATPYAEYNFFCDPEGAEAVLAGMKKCITIVPLETCNETVLSWEWYRQITQQKNAAAQLIKQFDEHTSGQMLKRNGDHYETWDQLAAAYIINPSVAMETKLAHAFVELHNVEKNRAQMIVNWTADKTNVRIMTKADPVLYQTLVESAFNLL